MKIKLAKPMARNSAVAEYDVMQIKKALNRLGYYKPSDEEFGLTTIPDNKMFEGLKKFQSDSGMAASGTLKPDDETADALNREIAKTPDGYYIWRTAEDLHVRPAHARFNRMLRKWSDNPDPGDDFGCRCWAQAVSKEDAKAIYNDAIKPVYPEAFLIPASRIKTIVNLLTMTVQSCSSPEIKMNDATTWPRPPVKGKLKEELASRSKPRKRGEKSLYDEERGEWRIHREDKYHNIHWDYKPDGQKSEWQDIEINNKPTEK